MSCYEEERGDYTLPSAEWAGFKAKIREAFNARQVKSLETATRIHDTIVAAGKGKRGFDYMDAFTKEVHVQRRAGYGAYGGTETIDLDPDGTIRRALFGNEYRPKPGTKPKRPLKKDFPLATNKTTAFECDEGHLSFDDQTRTVHWSVYNNNRSCERARQHPIAKVFFQALRAVKWTRDSGGFIEYTNEYAADADDSSTSRWSRKDGLGPRYQKMVEEELAMFSRAVGRSRPRQARKRA